LKRTTLIAAIILIFAATYVIEYYANSQFRSEELIVTVVPEFTGEEHRFNYIRSQDIVGSYTYSVEEQGGSYLMIGETDVHNEDGRIQLTAEYTFNDNLEPLEYNLMVLKDDENTEIVTEVIGEEIITFVTFQAVTVNITDSYIDGILVIDYNMPGFWEILFTSFELEMGVKYSGNIYIPQGATVFPINLVVNRSPQTIRIRGEQLSCTVVNEADLDLVFYLYEGELVQIRNDSQDIWFEKTS
jgi:hypothetical protein